jgi:flagellar protein FlaJ
MTGDSIKRLKQLFKYAVKKLFPWIPSILVIFKKFFSNTELGSTKPHILAYNLLGDKTNSFIPLFKDMDTNLRRAQVRISFRAYVSLTVFASIFASTLLLVCIPLLLISVFHMQMLFATLFGIGSALFGGAFVIIGFYLYPIYRAENLKRSIEDSLPFATSYMGVLAGAGVPPDKIFHSLASVDKNVIGISEEAKTIVRDIDLLGYDLISALKNASERSPSEKFKELLEGFIATIHSGGNVVAYLTDRSRQYMRLKRISLRKFSDTLSILAEFYVTFLVAGPLLLVVMLTVMAMLGGGIGLLDPTMLLYLLTYIFIPVSSIIFLLILDAVSPRW